MHKLCKKKPQKTTERKKKRKKKKKNWLPQLANGCMIPPQHFIFPNWIFKQFAASVK